eukprot:312236_1
MSDFCTVFRETYRKIDEETTFEQVTKRHIQLYHYARCLMEAVEFYGQEMYSEMKVYHGLQKVMTFTKFTAYFNHPISTTTSVRTAQSFSRGVGIILTLKSGSECFNDTSKKTKYLSVSFLSSFPGEDEKLFYGGNVVFQIHNIIEAQTKQGHLNELLMLNTFQRMLKNQNIKWNDESEKMVDALVILIQHVQQINNTNEKKQREFIEQKYESPIELNNKYITQYGKELFTCFCSNKNTSTVWIKNYKLLPLKLQTILFDNGGNNDGNASLLSFMPMTNLFCNLKDIRLNDLNLHQLTKKSKDYLVAVLQYITDSSKLEETTLETIIFQSKPQRDRKENSTLQKLANRYANIFNKHQWSIKYSFELERNHILMFTNNSHSHKKRKPIRQISSPVKLEKQRSIHMEVKLSYFIQITEITTEKCIVRLDAKNNNEATERYVIKNIHFPDQNELAEVSITCNRQFDTDDIYFEDDHHPNYQIALFRKNDYLNKQPLSNIISFAKYPMNMSYPPETNSNYKPNPVDTSTTIEVFDRNNQKLLLYWTIPVTTYGKIKYQIMYIGENDTNDSNLEDLKEETVKILPYTIPFSMIPVKLRIITISSFNQQKYCSNPSKIIHIGSTNEQKIDNTVNQVNIWHQETIWHQKLSYFMQVTNINAKRFDLLLMSDAIDTKIRKFRIKEYGLNHADCINKRIVIPKHKHYAHATVHINAKSDEFYSLFLYDIDNTEAPLLRSNQIKLIISKNENEYPPINKNYKPDSINSKTILKVKDEENHRVNIYWLIPPKSYGNISYKIINKNENDLKEEIVDLLPYSIPLSSIPISFEVITIARVADVVYQSQPSKTIKIGMIQKEQIFDMKKSSESEMLLVVKHALEILDKDHKTVSSALRAYRDKIFEYFVEHHISGNKFVGMNVKEFAS